MAVQAESVWLWLPHKGMRVARLACVQATRLADCPASHNDNGRPKACRQLFIVECVVLLCKS